MFSPKQEQLEQLKDDREVSVERDEEEILKEKNDRRTEKFYRTVTGLRIKKIS